MLVFLAGRRGAGKTSLARALAEHGFTRVHTTTVAEAHGLEKDPAGVFHDLAAPLGETILRAGARVVVDGCPRTLEQARLIDLLSATRPCLVVELVADEALSRSRMRARGNTQRSIDRAQARWEHVEARALVGFEPLRLDAAAPLLEHRDMVVARALRAGLGTL